jgi:hypothetical protein
MASPIKARTDQEAQQELKEKQGIKGDNWTSVDVMLTPKTFGTLMARQSAIDYFGIKMTVASTATKWIPRKISGAGKKVLRNGSEGITQKTGSPKGKLIKIPVNKDTPPTRKVGAVTGKLDGNRLAKLVDRKFYYFRVPPNMSLNAIAVMINTQFTKNKPAYVVTSAGKKYYINPSFNAASKLFATGEETGKAALDVPEDKTPVPGDTAKTA